MLMDILSQKHTQRQHLKAARNLLFEEERRAKSLAILQHLHNSSVWKNAQRVHCYCSFGSEVVTKAIIQTALNAEKRVFVPITKRHSPELLHVEVFPDTAFIPDSFDIPTPLHKQNEYVNPAHILTSGDCILVPMLGFDDRCFRIGYGKGHYDRFLSRVQEVSSVFTIGLAFAAQRVERIITEPHDIPLSTILTENGFMTSIYDA
jgi:5-formyltetrahydrofolate cyclo-ligase